MVFSSSECITMLAVQTAESVLIVTFNFVTILAFIKRRFLRQQSMYLVVNLAVADMLVGGFSEPLTAFFEIRKWCNIWNGTQGLAVRWFRVIFPITSLINLAAISVERAHATLRPFKQRVVTKRFYKVVVVACWSTAVLLAVIFVTIPHINEAGKSDYFYLWNSFNVCSLLVICVSYALLAAKIYCGRHPQQHGAFRRETKLTKTLLLVTILSLLMWLPYVITTFLYFGTDVFSSLSWLTNRRLNFVGIVFYYANSLVNPILYASKMPDFRRALISLFPPRFQLQGHVLPVNRQLPVQHNQVHQLSS
ncbi:neuropeptide FF receptor 2-like [Montipora foliosa]|uniref:neuropeptide FF receptor 2-like n=1 Tax=Montipora foliosa TaxID=591990 RepID=UPI0035F1DF9A